MCNLLYIKEFKQLIELKSQLSLQIRKSHYLRTKLEKQIEDINRYIEEILSKKESPSSFNLQDWLEYRHNINLVLQNINFDINQLIWKRKSVKNSLDYIPLG